MNDITPTLTSWHSPGKIYNFGHRAVHDVLKHPVQAQEKVDGSFFAFGSFVNDTGMDYELRCRSKGAIIYPDAPPGLFRGAVDTAKRLFDSGQLQPGWTYRGEALQSPKHNALAYDRTPRGNLILFDICTSQETFMSYDELAFEANYLGLEVVPQLARFPAGEVTPDVLRSLLDNTSVLGGQKIEGVVFKPLVPLFGIDGKFLMMKYVSEQFREVHKEAWGESNPSKGDIIATLTAKYGTPQRWQKAVIHAKELGLIQGDRPQDIGPLIKMIPADIWAECEEEIIAAVLKWAKDHLNRGFVAGFPEWYKEQLVAQQFEQSGDVLHAALHRGEL